MQGNVKEKVNNSAGIYSPLQIIPEMPPKVETSVIITFLNQQLNITCPGLENKLSSFLIFKMQRLSINLLHL